MEVAIIIRKSRLLWRGIAFLLPSKITLIFVTSCESVLVSFVVTIPVLACGLQIILKLLFLAYSSYLCKRTLLFGVVANLSIPALSRSVTQPRHLWLTVCGAHLFFHRQIPVDNSMILLVSISLTEIPWHQGWGFRYFYLQTPIIHSKINNTKGGSKIPSKIGCCILVTEGEIMV